MKKSIKQLQLQQEFEKLKLVKLQQELENLKLVYEHLKEFSLFENETIYLNEIKSLEEKIKKQKRLDYWNGGGINEDDHLYKKCDKSITYSASSFTNIEPQPKVNLTTTFVKQMKNNLK